MTEKIRRSGPVLVELDAQAAGQQGGAGERRKARADSADPPSPADAPPIEDHGAAMPRPATMELLARLAGRRSSRLTRFFTSAATALVTFFLSVAALNYIDRLLTRWPLLGWVGIGLFALFTLAVLGLAWREYRAWNQFARIDQIHRDAGVALASDDLEAAKAVAVRLDEIYAPRPEARWGRAELADRAAEAFDAKALLTIAETQLLAPLDKQARREIEAAARTVAAATALIPLALVDVAAALFANVRMIRRMAEIYGGRAGAVGGWRLARTVLAHLIATGAVAAGDDLIHTLAGGGVLAKLSRRFGEGVVNGALTARVGIAAMEVCRPLPFLAQPRPRVGQLLSRGLAGLFGTTSEPLSEPDGRMERGPD